MFHSVVCLFVVVVAVLLLLLLLLYLLRLLTPYHPPFQLTLITTTFPPYLLTTLTNHHIHPLLCYPCYLQGCTMLFLWKTRSLSLLFTHIHAVESGMYFVISFHTMQESTLIIRIHAVESGMMMYSSVISYEYHTIPFLTFQESTLVIHNYASLQIIETFYSHTVVGYKCTFFIQSLTPSEHSFDHITSYYIITKLVVYFGCCLWDGLYFWVWLVD